MTSNNHTLLRNAGRWRLFLFCSLISCSCRSGSYIIVKLYLVDGFLVYGIFERKCLYTLKPNQKQLRKMQLFRLFAIGIKYIHESVVDAQQ